MATVARPLPPLPTREAAANNNNNHHAAPSAPPATAAQGAARRQSTSAIPQARTTPAISHEVITVARPAPHAPDLSVLHARPGDVSRAPPPMYPAVVTAPAAAPAPPPRPLAASAGSSNAASMPEMTRRRGDSPPRPAIGGSQHVIRVPDHSVAVVPGSRPSSMRRGGAGLDGSPQGGGGGGSDLPPVRELSEWTVRMHGNMHQAVVTMGIKDNPKREVLLGNYGTEAEAVQACLAYAPPKWDESPASTCAVCGGQFGLLTRRRRHCRNCGRRVCSACCDRTWPATMMPFTCNEPNTRKAPVCDTCHFVMEEFRSALLRGDEATAKAAYGRGCVNLRCPYTIYDNELPVHCAARSGSISLLAWLLEDRFCPMYQDLARKMPMVNRQRHSVLAAAAAGGSLDTMRYLVWSHGADVHEITDLGPLWVALEKALNEGSDVAGAAARLRFHDADDKQRQHFGATVYYSNMGGGGEGGGPEVFATAFAPNAPPLLAETDGDVVAAAIASGNGGDDCIVCFENPTNCTLVPCGHHIVCMDCASKFHECPACRAPVERAIKTIRM